MWVILVFFVCVKTGCMLLVKLCFFFFQAEDGIRVLVRSRGLGDVYKRQRYNKQGQIIPFFYADAVVEMPFGALPGSMPGCYYWPRQWWEKCMRFGGVSEENNLAFCNEWIMGTKNQFEFVDKLGGAKWIAEARRQTKAAEADNEDIDFSYEEYTLTHDSGIYY